MKAKVSWSNGESATATVAQYFPDRVVLEFDHEIGEQYEFNQSKSGRWFEINNSLDFVEIEFDV